MRIFVPDDAEVPGFFAGEQIEVVARIDSEQQRRRSIAAKVPYPGGWFHVGSESTTC